MSAELDWFDVEVAIRRIADGEVRVARMREVRDTLEFGWSDGNYGCDCNRALFFARANGEDEPDIECGETAYAVDWIKDAETGEIVYSEA